MTTLELHDHAVSICEHAKEIINSTKSELVPATPSLNIFDINPNGFSVATDCPENAEFDIEITCTGLSTYSLTGGFIRPPQSPSPAMLSGGWTKAFLRVRARFPERNDLSSDWSSEYVVDEPIIETTY